MEIDVRDAEDSEINVIRVADRSFDSYVVDGIERSKDGSVCFSDTETEDERQLEIKNAEHARNIIRGLEKAIELGWFE